jgi:hypothetical protein
MDINMITESKNSIIVGKGSICNYNNCILIGDNLEATEDFDMQVGKTLFGQLLNRDLYNMIHNHPVGFRQFVEITFGVLQNMMTFGKEGIAPTENNER